MQVALFGGTGFVGSYLVDALVAAGHRPSLLVRAGSDDRVRQAPACRLVHGDISDPAAVEAVLEGCDAVVYNIGILREYPSRGITFHGLQYEGAKTAIDGARRAGIERFILMSANGIDARATAYQESKFQAEQHLKQSGLAGTVFRPSVVFGDPRGRMEFCTQLRADMIRPPIPAPNFFTGWSPSRGGFSMSPVQVEDVAQSFVRSLENADTVGGCYPLCGPEALPWPEIIRRIAAASGRRKLILPAPVGPIRLIAAIFDRFESFPVTRDQLTMLVQGNTGDSRAIFGLLGIEPRRFDADGLAYLGPD
ncbi:MAG: NAD(P)H-binding protein [Gammaproteobacteria bacterium]|jgi:NADH dehydrogenase